MTTRAGAEDARHQGPSQGGERRQEQVPRPGVVHNMLRYDTISVVPHELRGSSKSVSLQDWRGEDGVPLPHW